MPPPISVNWGLGYGFRQVWNRTCGALQHNAVFSDEANDIQAHANSSATRDPTFGAGSIFLGSRSPRFGRFETAAISGPHLTPPEGSVPDPDPTHASPEWRSQHSKNYDYGGSSGQSQRIAGLDLIQQSCDKAPLDEGAIDEFIITVVPIFIGEGIPLLAPRHRQVALRLLCVQQFPDGVVQLHYEVQR
jgi:hypothetical protein